MTHATTLCIRCKGLDPDCGSCLGAGRVPGDDGTFPSAAQDPRLVADVLRDEVLNVLAPERVQESVSWPSNEEIIRGFIEQFEDDTVLPSFLIGLPKIPGDRRIAVATLGDQADETIAKILRTVSDNFAARAPVTRQVYRVTGPNAGSAARDYPSMLDIIAWVLDAAGSLASGTYHIYRVDVAAELENLYDVEPAGELDVYPAGISPRWSLVTPRFTMNEGGGL